LAGYVAMHYLPSLGAISLLPATIFGVLGYNGMSTFTSQLAAKMHVSTSFREEHFIGSLAEVTVPIVPGRLGEIVYLAKGSRCTGPARTRNTESTIQRSKSVIIIDLIDGIFVVEPNEKPDGSISIPLREFSG